MNARACCFVVVGALALPGAAVASPTQESTFQDDALLVNGSPAVQARTLDTIKALGGDRVRVSLVWRLVAPAPNDPRKPVGFDAANPAAYPPGAWDRYDRLVRLADRRGLGIGFVITSPAPNWATGSLPSHPELDPTFDPLAVEFDAFVRAAAKRYPGVHYWSLWNEPNDASSLTPQWLPDPRDPTRFVPTSPQVYRRLLDVGWAALQQTGHAHDTILVGETAPKGLLDNVGPISSIDAQRFIREVYCLDDNLQFYAGPDAEVRGCPPTNQIATFTATHPALFLASGWAHHPYELSRGPDEEPTHPDSWVTLGNLRDLTRLMRRIRERYGRPTDTPVPLYLTRYGYATKPPNDNGVSPALQAEYLNHAEYLTWRNRSVRTLGQFLLKDSGSFQSGLRTAGGAPKPAYDAYALPVWLPSDRIRAGKSLRVWGLVRAAPNNRRVQVSIQVRRRRGAPWQRVARRATTGTRDYLSTSVRVQRSGQLRLVWNGRHSRAASFTVSSSTTR
ncbi:MAG TPA: hypothetical protein VKB54_05890 [Solirubrobacteraceae bacterium]|nr:hypothetical protein [Solirubrobacteraceae bacterium]